MKREPVLTMSSLRFRLSLFRVALFISIVLLSLTAHSQDSPSIPTQSFAVSGLNSPAEILIDRWGVPHMYAKTFDDAFFLQGFNAARDRLWQIDLWRRRGLGLLSEVFGPEYVEQDRAARLFLFRGDMYREWLAYSSDSKRIAEAFVAGINAFIVEAKKNSSLMPTEFKMLGYEPAEWKPEDVVRIRSHALTRNVTSEVARSLTACRFGIEKDVIRRGLEPLWRTEVPEGMDPCAIPANVLGTYRLATSKVTFPKAGAALDQGPKPQSSLDRTIYAAALTGSNNWAIGPNKSSTGRPILASDPHRDHSVPSLRYIAHLSAPGLNVIGAGEPALPGISIGHNERIAFGLTIFGIDQEDLYVYETNPENGNEYRYASRWEPMRIVEEQIRIRDREPQTVAMKFTRHGPVIFEDHERHRAYAVKTVWLEPGTAAYFGSIDYMRAGNWDQFLASMNRWGTPSENQVYADVEGNIAWVPGGLAPVRKNWDGLMPVSGDGRYEWDGFLDRDQLPHEFNPARGWTGSANQMNLPEGYPYSDRKIGFEWADPSRWLRIREVLESKPKVSLADSMNLQNDYFSIPARRVTALLNRIKSEDAKMRAAIQLLTNWDHVLAANSGAAALFEVWFTKHLRPGIIAATVPQGGVAAIGDGDTWVIVGLLEKPDSSFGSNPESARDHVLAMSLSAAIENTEKLLGTDWNLWQWGKLHQAIFTHPLADRMDSRAKAQASVGPIPTGGGLTVNASTYRTSDFRLVGGPSFRMVIDVGNWNGSWAINTPGQSGNVSSPHYRDLVGDWAAGKYFPLLFTRDAIEKAAEQRIEFKPITSADVRR
jgi:penicillin G amidase